MLCGAYALPVNPNLKENMRKMMVLLFVLLILITGVWAETYTTQPGAEGKDAQVTNVNPNSNYGDHLYLLNGWGG